MMYTKVKAVTHTKKMWLPVSSQGTLVSSIFFMFHVLKIMILTNLNRASHLPMITQPTGTKYPKPNLLIQHTKVQVGQRIPLTFSTQFLGQPWAHSLVLI